jgi:hypothetical protein
VFADRRADIPTTIRLESFISRARAALQVRQVTLSSMDSKNIFCFSKFLQVCKSPLTLGLYRSSGDA